VQRRPSAIAAYPTQPRQPLDHRASKEGSLCVGLVCPGAYELPFVQVSNKKKNKYEKKTQKTRHL